MFRVRDRVKDRIRGRKCLIGEGLKQLLRKVGVRFKDRARG
jgi:hypothetical protein